MDGCLISGAASYHKLAIYNVTDTRNYGTSTDPLGSLGGSVLVCKVFVQNVWRIDFSFALSYRVVSLASLDALV